MIRRQKKIAAASRQPQEDTRLGLQPEPDASSEDTLLFIRGIVSHFAISHPHENGALDAWDLFQEAWLGYRDACEKFDPNRGVKFETYAKHRIRGAMLDALRALDTTGRLIRSSHREIQQAENELADLLGRAPSDEEVATALGKSLQWVQKRRAQSEQASIASLEKMTEKLGTAADHLRCLTMDGRMPDGSPANAVESDEIAEVVDKLTVRLRFDRRFRAVLMKRMLARVFDQEPWGGSELAQELGVSDSRISQIEAKIRLTLQHHWRLICAGKL